MTIHDAINEYLKQCEARKLSWSTLKAYRCDLEILDRSQRHTELLDIESEELQKIIKGNGSLKPATMLRRSVSFHIFFQYCKEKGYIQETPVIKSQRVKLQTPVTLTADKVTDFNPRSHEGSDSNFRQKVLFSLSKNCLKYLILTTNYFN